MKKIKIGKHFVGIGAPCFIIAEAGLNHNGSLTRALKMVDIAKQCGADAIKFQTFKTEEFISNKKETYSYISQGRRVTESMFAMFKRYELKKNDFQILACHCKKKEILFMSTPQNIGDLEILLTIGVPAIKVGSDDLTNIPLMKAYSQKGLPMIISTGMGDFKEIQETVREIKKKNNKLIILLCVSSYPAQLSELNLTRIQTLQKAFKKDIVGFSDHSVGTIAAVGAVALGAKVIEKHFTLNNNLPGPDHRFSADPLTLKKMVDDIRDIEKAIGDSKLVVSSSELKMRKLARRSIVAARDVKKGTTLSIEDIAFKRPGTGIMPRDINKVIGKKTEIKLKKDQIILKRNLR